MPQINPMTGRPYGESPQDNPNLARNGGDGMGSLGGGNYSNTLSGAAAGGASGFMAAGPYGAIAGAGAGGYAGYKKDKEQFQAGQGGGDGSDNYDLPGYDMMNGRYSNFIGQGPRNAPQAGMSGFQGDQQQLAGMLMGQAQGNGPGQEIARQQAAQQTDRGLGQQLAMARSGRPGSSAMGARNAAMASGQLQGQGAQAATMGGLQAQQQAIGSLGNVLGQARGQDQSLALGNAGLQQQGRALDDQRQLDLLRQQLQMNRYQQLGIQGYGAEQGKQGRFDELQPSNTDRALGAIQGGLMAYGQYKSGSGGTSNNTSGGSPDYFGKSNFGNSDPNNKYL